MANGNGVSPIVRAIADSEKATTGEIRVHTSRRRTEKDVFGRATRIFRAYGMDRTTQRNAVLFYVNLRARKFAIVADQGAAEAVEPGYWDELAAALKEDLLSTHPENAISIAVRTVGATLSRYFPVSPS